MPSPLAGAKFPIFSRIPPKVFLGNVERDFFVVVISGVIYAHSLTQGMEAIFSLLCCVLVYVN